MNSKATAEGPTLVPAPPIADLRFSPDPIESELYQLIADNNKDACLTAIDTLYGDRLYRFIRTMMGNAASADDVFQTTLVQIYRDLGDYKKRSTIRAWVFTIARHRCLDALKADRRRKKRVTSTPETLDVPSTVPPPSEQLDQAKLQEILANCLLKLNPKIRIAVLMRYQENISYDKIAEATQEQPPAVRARVSRALPLLRTCIEKKGNV